MKPSPQYMERDPKFWAFVRLLSEKIGYSKEKQPLQYDFGLARGALLSLGLSDTSFSLNGAPTELAGRILKYLNFRSELLTTMAEPNLMDGEEACDLLGCTVTGGTFDCPMPMNKQKGEMKHLNYLTCLVNSITESELSGYHFNGDPQGLAVVLHHNEPVTVMCRRVDGVYPAVTDAQVVWEIKEYYDNKTFGSRIADGVYETLLDGYELGLLSATYGIEVKHYLILDSYSTWWLGGGIPYLCRLIDAMHMGLVTEVIVGREVTTRWPEIVRSWLD